MIESLQLFWDSFELFKSAIYASLIAGFVLGAIGTYIAAQRIVFVSATLSQTSSLGIVSAFFLQQFFDSHSIVLSPILWGAGISFWAVLILSQRKETGILGGIFIFASAGTLLISSKIIERLSDVKSLLFGTAVAVPEDELQILAFVLGLIFIIHVWWFRGFLSVSLDPIGAKTRGIPKTFLQLVLMATLAVSISETTRVLGALPAFAFSVLPGLVGISVAKTFRGAFIIAAVLGALGGSLGYLIAYLFNLPVGGSQAFLLACIFLISLIFKKK